jgi:5'-nucleotidase
MRTLCFMLILLTNDDGIHAPGLLAMYRELMTLGEVHVVAPATVQSAAGHGITLSGPLLTRKIILERDCSGVAVEGSPADCVKLAAAQILPRNPDLVISGINAGANVGINILYSGTVAAAIEAAFLGFPSIALSLLIKNNVPIDYPRTAVFARNVIDQILSAGLSAGQIISVNLPALLPHENPAGIKVVRQCTRPWTDTYERRTDPKGQDYYWNSSVFTLDNSGQDTDVAALRDGYITLTPLQFDLTHYALLRQWEERKWNLQK